MILDDLISAADPARGRAFPGGTVNDARRLIDQLEANQLPVTSGSRTRRSRGLRRLANVLLPACAIGVVVLIATLAVVLVGHTARTDRSAAPTASRPSGPPRTIGRGPSTSIDRALTAELGILRRPQTPAAHAFNIAPKLGVRLAQSVPFIPSLTRAIKLPHRVTLYLYVAQRTENRTRGGREHLAPGGLGVMLRAPFQGFGYCCLQPRKIKRPVGPQATPYTMSQKPDWLYVELVPDGVATVRWTFPTAIVNGRPLPHGKRTVTVRVHDNVAAIALPHTGSGNSGGTQSDAWYSADGQLLARHTS